jgi:hypothetical protein
MMNPRHSNPNSHMPNMEIKWKSADIKPIGMKKSMYRYLLVMIYKSKCCLLVNKNFFSKRDVNSWNALPSSVVI